MKEKYFPTSVSACMLYHTMLLSGTDLLLEKGMIMTSVI